MGELTRVFPFPGRDETKDAAKRAVGVDLLQRAKAAETRAAEALAEAAANWPG